MKDKIDPGDGKGSFRINQNANDIVEGFNRGGDLSRTSVYRGDHEGVHTGSNSETVGRHGEKFGK